MVDNLRIDVTQEEFEKKSEPERSWMLFLAITQINSEGCQWAKKTNWIMKAYLIAGAAGIVGGALAIFTKWVCGG